MVSTPEDVPESFSKILFRREGGGNKEFYVTVDEARQLLSFDVVKYNFQATSYAFDRPAPEDRETYHLVTSILSGRTPVSGGGSPAAKQTGTWVHMFAVTAQDDRVEITDRRVRERLLALESAVESRQAELSSPR